MDVWSGVNSQLEDGDPLGMWGNDLVAVTEVEDMSAVGGTIPYQESWIV